MKQVLQSLRNGKTFIEDVPVPLRGKGNVLIRSNVSLVSAGTERMLATFGKSSLLSKARQHPDKVRQVLDKVRSDGVGAAYEAVQSKLNQPLAIGYCNAGTVVESDLHSTGLKVGDRVASNGSHSEYVVSPKNLCARIPENVSFEGASFTVIGAVALQGIRLVAPQLAERVVVIGLGMVGLLTVQMLHAQGCHVLGIDVDPARLSLAKKFGAETLNSNDEDNLIDKVNLFSGGQGVDAVIIAASTNSSKPVSQAAMMCRKRGRIILVGAAGLNLSREDFYEKEITFQVSCSYGPGRYDANYEEKGNDYPIGFVRWTEQRNFEAVLELIASKRLDVSPLITHRYDIENADRAMNMLVSDEPSMGILLKYPDALTAGQSSLQRDIQLNRGRHKSRPGRIGFIGAGNYATRTLIPAFLKANAEMGAVASSSGVTATIAAQSFGFDKYSSDSASIYSDAAIDTVVIATRHNDHADQGLDALSAGKHVFCEKPLCLTLDELDSIEKAIIERPSQLLMVGYNRRFAPHTIQIKKILDAVDEPKTFIMTINAGEIPHDSWQQNLEVGGGRIVGEACHFIDLLRHLADAPIVGYRAVSLGRNKSFSVTDDKAIITLEFADGSIGVVNYLANGHRTLVKERLEIFVGGRVLQLDNFLRLKIYGPSKVRPKKLWRQDKGQANCAKAFIDAVRGRTVAPINLEEIMEVSRVSIEIADSLR